MFKKLFGFGKKSDEEKKQEDLQEGQVQEEVLEEGQEETHEEASLAEETNERFEAVDAPQVDTSFDPLASTDDPALSVETEDADPVEEPVQEEPQEALAEEPVKKGFFGRLMDGLNKTRHTITDAIDDLLNNYGEIDDDLFEELEEILIMADVGMTTTMKLIDNLREELKARKINDASQVKGVLHDVMEDLLILDQNHDLNIEPAPAVVLVIGVNGAGKTTSIGKISNYLKTSGKNVLLAAADTFRAAAIDQLKVWGDRANVNVIAHQEGADPAAVIFDAIQAAKSRKAEVLICDTAGRLHNKKNLMNELEKIHRVIEREYPEATKEVLLVLDATTGQNAIQQAKLFSEAAGITGIVLTKLDGTAKGGAILAVKEELGIPVKMIGVGEGINDLQPFDPKAFVKALMDV